jgi:hypothetical protein
MGKWRAPYNALMKIASAQTWGELEPLLGELRNARYQFRLEVSKGRSTRKQSPQHPNRLRPVIGDDALRDAIDRLHSAAYWSPALNDPRAGDLKWKLLDMLEKISVWDSGLS